ncbi:hypothetical protein FB451DRAFT_1187416 [Mycena latifolia]|nr:hypothetical protein FB451DRAFT_1187416 [Mycena latifolia]
MLARGKLITSLSQPTLNAGSIPSETKCTDDVQSSHPYMNSDESRGARLAQVVNGDTTSRIGGSPAISVKFAIQGREQRPATTLDFKLFSKGERTVTGVPTLSGNYPTSRKSRPGASGVRPEGNARFRRTRTSDHGVQEAHSGNYPVAVRMTARGGGEVAIFPYSWSRGGLDCFGACKKDAMDVLRPRDASNWRGPHSKIAESAHENFAGTNCIIESQTDSIVLDLTLNYQVSLTTMDVRGVPGHKEYFYLTEIRDLRGKTSAPALDYLCAAHQGRIDRSSGYNHSPEDARRPRVNSLPTKARRLTGTSQELATRASGELAEDIEGGTSN